MVCEFGPVSMVLPCYGVIGYFKIFFILFDSSLCSLFWNFMVWLVLFCLQESWSKVDLVFSLTNPLHIRLNSVDESIESELVRVYSVLYACFL